MFQKCFQNVQLFSIIFSPQVKRSKIINNKYGIYELPHQLPNDLKLRILGNQEISSKSQNVLELKLCAQSSSQNDNFPSEKQKLNFSISALFHMKTRVCPKYFVRDFVQISCLPVYSMSMTNAEKITGIDLIFVYLVKLLSNL